MNIQWRISYEYCMSGDWSGRVRGRGGGNCVMRVAMHFETSAFDGSVVILSNDCNAYQSLDHVNLRHPVRDVHNEQ